MDRSDVYTTVAIKHGRKDFSHSTEQINEAREPSGFPRATFTYKQGEGRHQTILDFMPSALTFKLDKFQHNPQRQIKATIKFLWKNDGSPCLRMQNILI